MTLDGEALVDILDTVSFVFLTPGLIGDERLSRYSNRLQTAALSVINLQDRALLTLISYWDTLS